jgi:hypothetical protein
MGNLEKVRIPNIEGIEDAKKIFTIHFKNGQEIWQAGKREV